MSNGGVVFRRLRFRNFMSFGNIWSEFDLTQRGTTLIIGENLDEGGSSGAGKTTALSALSFCLYDKIPAGVSKDKLINTTNDKKSTGMEVELFFSKGDDHYKIRRARGAHTGVHLYKMLADGEKPGDKTVEFDKQFYNDVTADSVSNFNSVLENLIGFSYELFETIILFSGNEKPFLSKSVGDQRRLIEELFKITALSKKARALKTQSNETEKSIEVEKVIIRQTELRAQEQKKHMVDAVSRCEKWDQQRLIDNAKMIEQLEDLMGIDFDAEESKFEELRKLETEASPLEQAIVFKRQERQMKAKERCPKTTQAALISADIFEREKSLIKLEKELTHLRDAKCPYCLQEFEDAQKKIGELESSSKTMNAELADLRARLSMTNREINEFDEALAVGLRKLDEELVSLTAIGQEAKQKVANVKSKLIYTSLSSLLDHKNKIATVSNRLEEMQTETNPHLEAALALGEEDEIVVSLTKLDSLVLQLEQEKFLYKLLTDKSSFIRKNIIAKTIPFLNKRIAYYTEKLNLPHIVLFQPDMSCNITQYGRELDHGNLSNGEKKKLNISLCLSFRDVLTYLHSKVNILFTDEVDGGSISGQDVDSLIGLMKHKAWDEDISIFIVSHRPEFEGRTDRSVVVRKEGGFSTLITTLET